MIGSLISAWLDVRAKPLRTVAAIAGMVAAIVAVVLVDAANVLSHDANDVYLATQYGLPITISITGSGQNDTATEADVLESTLRENGITALSRDFSLPLRISYGSTPVFNGVRWLSSTYPDVRIVDLVAGSWPKDTAQSDTLHVVLHTGWAQQALGLSDQDVIGKTLGYTTDLAGTFDPQVMPVRPMVVDGVVAIDTNAFANGTSPIVVVSDLPHPELMALIPGFTWAARVNPDDFSFTQNLVASIKDTQGTSIYSAHRSDSGDRLAPVLNQQSVTARAVSLVALIIGGLGIFGVGLASVRERQHDFGLRRALGATRLRIFGDVIVQTVFETLLAAAIAIPIAAISVQVFARKLVLASLPMPPATSLPISSAMLGLVSAMIVGLFASLIPATHAARSSVIHALRGS
ncbi:MAG: ABC transporter permease [Thermomicrobiales bacterium]